MEEPIRVSEARIQNETGRTDRSVLLQQNCSCCGAGEKLRVKNPVMQKAGSESVSAVAKYDCERGLDQDLNIEPDRPAARVP